MRLDKFIGNMTSASRSEIGKAAKKGQIFVNGIAVKDPSFKVDPERDSVVFRGEKVEYVKHIYIMLNKPEGVVSATEDGKDRTVLDLLPEELMKREPFPCGRLDKYTVGLMLITDDGDMAHKLLSPAHHVSKKYYFKCEKALSDSDIEEMESGVVIDGYKTKPSKIEADDGRMSGYITLTEGKYHQIKRMFEKKYNKITYLERVTFGPLTLDPSLERGEWRYLSESETDALSYLVGR